MVQKMEQESKEAEEQKRHIQEEISRLAKEAATNQTSIKGKEETIRDLKGKIKPIRDGLERSKGDTRKTEEQLTELYKALNKAGKELHAMQLEQHKNKKATEEQRRLEKAQEGKLAEHAHKKHEIKNAIHSII